MPDKIAWLIGWSNYLVWQWFWFRIGYCESSDGSQVDRLVLLTPIVPLTGWRTDYRPARYRTVTLWRRLVPPPSAHLQTELRLRGYTIDDILAMTNADAWNALRTTVPVVHPVGQAAEFQPDRP